MTAKKRKTKGTPNDMDIHVGQRLRVRRSLLGLSQEKLADFVGITFQQIQKYERGMNRVSAGRLYQLSKALEVPIAYFFENTAAKSGSLQSGFSDSKQDPFSYSDLTQSKETKDLLKAYYTEKNPQRRKDILKIVRSMASAAK